jgi:hypothetical protein
MSSASSAVALAYTDLSGHEVLIEGDDGGGIGGGKHLLVAGLRRLQLWISKMLVQWVVPELMRRRKKISKSSYGGLLRALANLD